MSQMSASSSSSTSTSPSLLSSSSMDELSKIWSDVCSDIEKLDSNQDANNIQSLHVKILQLMQALRYNHGKSEKAIHNISIHQCAYHTC